MDSLKTLMEKKQFDLVIQITENSRDAHDLFYRITALLATGRPLEALDVIRENRRLLQKDDLVLLLKMHIEILCLLAKFDEAYDEMEYYENLPYESQIMEEQLKAYRKYIREQERLSFSSKDLTNEEISKRLDNEKATVVLDGLQSLRDKNIEQFMPKIQRIMLDFPMQAVRSFALMLLVEKKYNGMLKFNHVNKVIEVNPSLLIPPFIDEKFQNFLKLIQSDFRNPALSQNAENIYSTYLIYIYPDQGNYNEAALLCALYGVATEFLQTDGDESLEDKCKRKGVDMDEVSKIMDALREAIEIL